MTSIPNYNRLPSNLKEKYLAEQTEKIFDAHNYIANFTNLYKAYYIKEIPPCATNFRDSLFHFKKLYDADTYEEALAQIESSDEHMNRLIKDSLVKYCLILVESFTEIYSSDVLDPKGKSELQHIIHLLKNYVLDIRSKSLNINRINGTDEVGRLKEYAPIIDQFLQKYSLKDKFLELNSNYSTMPPNLEKMDIANDNI